jgi:hypothetical protein
MEMVDWCGRAPAVDFAAMMRDQNAEALPV